jgi:CRP-like cAMP-binding protein
MESQSSLPSTFEALRTHNFLSGITDTQLASLATMAEHVQFREYDLILAAKQPAHAFFLLLSGSASVELNKQHFAVRIQGLEAGDAFGCSALLDGHESMFNVRARESCSALRFDGERLRKALRDDPVLAAELFRRSLQSTTRRLHATEVRLGELCGVRITTPKERMASTIRALNKLMETCLDGELGYQTAADYMDDSKLKPS